MSDKKILLYDDSKEQAEEWVDKLAEHADRKVQRLKSDEFLRCIEVLEKRRKDAREGKFSSFNEACLLDEAGIFIVDYDLIDVDKGEGVDHVGYLTGEDVAYLARSYSKCDVIVALNQFGDSTFDLRLRGYPESFADLNVGSTHFADAGLWKDDDWREYRPWAWLNLVKLEESFSKRCEEIEGEAVFDSSILEFLGLQEGAVGVLPRELLEFIQVRNSDPALVTFRDFVELSGMGLRPKDKTSRENMRRIAAAKVYQWLNCLVLGGQDVLVDIPHLVSRFPSLIEGAVDTLEDWNSMVLPGLPGRFNHKVIKPQEFDKKHWLSRPAWLWGAVRRNQRVDEVRGPWDKRTAVDCVFCEDSSRFIKAEDATEFVADLPSPFTRRYVQIIESVAYRPSVRFAL